MSTRTTRIRSLAVLGLGLGLLSLTTAIAFRADKADPAPKPAAAPPVEANPVEVRIVWQDLPALGASNVGLIAAPFRTGSLLAGASLFPGKFDRSQTATAGDALVDISIAAKGEQKEVPVLVELHDTVPDSTGRILMLGRTVLKVPAITADKWHARVPVPFLKEAKKQHRLSVSVFQPDLGIDTNEDIYFSDQPAAPVQTHGIRSVGVYPARKVYFTLTLNGFKEKNLRDVPVDLKVHDDSGGKVFDRKETFRPSAEPQRLSFEVTPETSADVGPFGPFKAEANIEYEAATLFFNATLPFAQPNAIVPFSSMEHGDPTQWFAAQAPSPDSFRSWELFPTGTEVYYNSDHLRDLHPRDNPRVSYDRAEKHSGRQSLRVDYLTTGEANVWSHQPVPGKPLYVSFWVKGNESQDQLAVHFVDNANVGIQSWYRWANFSSAAVGKLDFAGWRQFRVPVLGYGQQVIGQKGPRGKVSIPVRLLAFSIKPAPDPKAPKSQRRSIWIDDLAAETQVSPTPQSEADRQERDKSEVAQIAPTYLLSMELQGSDPHGRLTADGKLAVCVGNGYAVELKKGRIVLTAKDAAAAVVWTRTLDLPVVAGTYASVEVPLAELAAKKPAGPVVVEVKFEDATRPGASVARSIALKAASQAAVVLDFEDGAVYSGFQPGKVGKSKARIVEGGADGKGHALAISVLPKEADGSVLFHPALPGIVDSVEMMVEGGAKPVTLQVWFLDSGNTGIWIRPYNIFWAEPIVVDWQGWKKVSVPAPAIPANNGDKRRYFFQQPWYPLNLAINATVDSVEPREVPVEIRIDDVRVVTHLPAVEQVQAEISYPGENRIHAPASPLALVLTNFAATPKPLALTYQLRSYQGHVARSGKLDVTLPAGARQRVALIDKLAPGIYDLEVQGVGPQPLIGCVMVLDSGRYFGDNQEELLTNPHLLRRLLNLTTERLYLDWDNSEPVPSLLHSHWFEMELKKKREISQLPKDLQPLFVKQTEANAVVTRLDAELRNAQNQAINTERNEKPIADKIAADMKALVAVKGDVDAAAKTLEPLVKKADDAAAKAKDAAAKNTDALKAQQTADAILKTAQQTSAAADKVFQDADKAAKAAEDQVKPATDAADKTAKELSAAEAALKKAEDAKDEKAIDEAKKKLKVAQDQDAAAKKKAEDAKKLAETLRPEADKLKVKAEAAKKDAEKANTDAVAAKKDADKAKQDAADTTKVADMAKAERMKADQQYQAVKKKSDDLEKVIANDKVTLEQRVKATADAFLKVEQTQKDLDTARTTLAAAAKEYDAARSKYDFTILPVVGFCTDWAGPESADALQRGSYMRWIPNTLQVPKHPVDWSLFVRAIMREYKGRFDHWVFWENPDLEDAPQGLPPKKYAEMLSDFARWVKLYNPEAKVVLGGMNFSKSLGYLRRIPDAHRLPFDEVHVQMNLGELSPEAADVEGYLDDLNARLHLPETKRAVRITELDWGIGQYLSPMRQAANHARAMLILDSRGVSDHQFALINTGYDFDGAGVFYRVAYGNGSDLQTHKPTHVPKPSFFALYETRRFLKEWKYVASAQLSDRSLADNRAFVYRNAAGDLTVALWRTVEGERSYRLPAAWKDASAQDVFTFPVALDRGLPCTPLPIFVRMPAGYALDQLLYDLRMLQRSDEKQPSVLLDLHLAEPDSVKRAGYQSTGKTEPIVHAGQIAGDRKVRETYLHGLETESFTFTLSEAGNVLLRRNWYFEGDGQKLHVKLNDGPEQVWDQTKGQGNEAGVRETTFILRGCKAGSNRVAVRYEKPGNCAGYRLEPLSGDNVPLVRWGVLNTRQSRGEIALHTSAVGTPLSFGKERCGDGIGAHAVSFIEYPLDGQFSAFEVTVGIDGSTEGRGSVVFKVYVDGKEKKSSDLMTGFTKAKTLRVDGLEGARRLILSVTDGEDGNRDDVANWVDGKLYFRAK